MQFVMHFFMHNFVISPPYGGRGGGGGWTYENI